MTSSFQQAFTKLIGNEGQFSNESTDPGNWTGGKIGVGELKGTKYGVSAAQFPDLDIENLTLEQAQAIAKAKYWDVYQCDQFDPRIGFQIFDAAYNGGHPAQWLQQAAGVTDDGVIGAATIAAVRATDPLKIILRFDAARLKYMVGLQVWPTYGKGWADRIANNMQLAAT